MKHLRYQVIMEQGAGQAVRRFHFHTRIFTALKGLGILAAVGVLALTVHYGTLSVQMFDAVRLENENARLTERLASLKARVDGTLDEVSRLEALSSDIRKSTRLKENGEYATGPSKRTSPLGGALEAFALPITVQDPDVVALRAELVDGHIDRLRAMSSQQLRSLTSLNEYFKTRQQLLDETPSVWPASGYFTSNFGYREDPFTGARILHAGIDISADIGTPVYAPASGVVVVAGQGGGYGNLIEIDHNRGIRTRYGHLSRIFVKPGDEVKRGKLIGHVGNTGRSTGPHLHYEVRKNNTPENPEHYVVEW